MMKKDEFMIGIIFLGITIFAFFGTLSFFDGIMRMKESGEGSLMMAIIPLFFWVYYFFLLGSGAIGVIMLGKNLFDKDGVYKPLSAVLAGICLGLVSSGIAFRIMAVN